MTVRKAIRNKYRENMIGLKIKIKKKRKKKNSTGLQKPNVDAEVYNNNKKNVTEGEKAQKLN